MFKLNLLKSCIYISDYTPDLNREAAEKSEAEQSKEQHQCTVQGWEVDQGDGIGNQHLSAKSAKRSTF